MPTGDGWAGEVLPTKLPLANGYSPAEIEFHVDSPWHIVSRSNQGSLHHLESFLPRVFRCKHLTYPTLCILRRRLIHNVFSSPRMYLADHDLELRCSQQQTKVPPVS